MDLGFFDGDKDDFIAVFVVQEIFYLMLSFTIIYFLNNQNLMED